MTDHLLARKVLPDDVLYDALSKHWAIGLADLTAQPPDPRLIDRWGALACLADGLLPWRRIGDVVVIAVSDPAIFACHRPQLLARIRRCAAAHGHPGPDRGAILAARGKQLARASEQTVPLAESCRRWSAQSSLWLVLGCLILATCIVLWPALMMAGLLIWAMLALIATTGIKAAAMWLTLRRDRPDPGPPPVIARLPTVSVIVALYREADIAARLVRRLGKLDYPRNLLDIVLVVEAADDLTRTALAKADLPPSMRLSWPPKAG